MCKTSRFVIQLISSKFTHIANYSAVIRFVSITGMSWNDVCIQDRVTDN